jgi:hypothetical protein
MAWGVDQVKLSISILDKILIFSNSNASFSLCFEFIDNPGIFEGSLSQLKRLLFILFEAFATDAT